MLDRTIAPPSYKIKQCRVPLPQQYMLFDKVPVYYLSIDTQPVIQMEIVFDSGIWYEQKRGVSYFAANMLQEGTETRDFQQVSEFVDFYGSMLEIRITPDTVHLTCSFLSKFLVQMLDFIYDILTNSIFPEDRLEHIKDLKIQHLKLDSSKNDRIARKKFRASIYSDDHPYGSSLTTEDVNAITKEDIDNFYNNILFNSPKIFISGTISLADIETIQQSLSKFTVLDREKIVMNNPISDLDVASLSIQGKENSVQASICIGKKIIEKRHEDFIHLLITNTIFGGFFGSKLMKNIREVNGYTYGIYSQIVSLYNSGYLLISAEVDKQYASLTCEEINREVYNLQNVPINKVELRTLKNYLMGTIKSDMDNPISVMEKIKSVYLYGLDINYFDDLYDSIYNISEDQILEISNKYLKIEEMSKIIVG